MPNSFMHHVDINGTNFEIVDKKLRENVDDLIEYIEYAPWNLITQLSDGAIIDDKGNINTDYPAWSYTDFIPVLPNITYTQCSCDGISVDIPGGVYVAFYDDNKNFIERKGGNKLNVLTPNDCAYARLSVQTVHKEKLVFGKQALRLQVPKRSLPYDNFAKKSYTWNDNYAVLSSDGNIIKYDNNSWKTTEYIRLKKGTYYILPIKDGGMYFTAYDDNFVPKYNSPKVSNVTHILELASDTWITLSILKTQTTDIIDSIEKAIADIEQEYSELVLSNELIDGDYTYTIPAGTRYQNEEITVNVIEKHAYSLSIDSASEALDAQVASVAYYDSNNNQLSSYNVPKVSASLSTTVAPKNAVIAKVALWFSTTTVAQSDITVTMYGVHFYESKAIRKKTNLNDNNKVYCIGDSLTMGAGSLNNPYPSMLQALIPDYSVVNYGIGGEGSETICARMCGFYVDPFIIPATESPVEISLHSIWGGNIYPLLQESSLSNAGMNPVLIDGVFGTITVSGNNRTYYFTRSNSGSSQTVSRPAFVYTDAQLVNKDNAIAIIWAGTNDIYAGVDDSVEYKSMTYTLSRINEILRQLNTDKYMVLALTIVNRPSVAKLKENVSEFNRLASLEYGSHFIDIYSYLLHYGLSDAGISPTSQDTQDMSDGIVPSSLFSDNTHLNESGYRVLANYLYERGKQMGFWN